MFPIFLTNDCRLHVEDASDSMTKQVIELFPVISYIFQGVALNFDIKKIQTYVRYHPLVSPVSDMV